MTEDELVHAFKRALAEYDEAIPQLYKAEIEYVRRLIKQDEMRAARLEKFKLSLVGTLATGFLAGLVWVGALVWEALHRGS